jgi:hypothetical protein
LPKFQRNLDHKTNKVEKETTNEEERKITFKYTTEKSENEIEKEIREYRNNLEKLIPEFYQNNQTKSDDSYDDENRDNLDESVLSASLCEEEKIELFKKLRTRNKFHSSTLDVSEKDNKNLSKNITKLYTKNSISLSKVKNRNISSISEMHSPRSEIFSTQIKQYPNRINSQHLHDLTKKHSELMNNNQTIINIKKINQKIRLIDNLSNKKKENLCKNEQDLFIYNKVKWDKKNIRESDKVLNDIKHFEERRDDMLKKIFSMDDVISKIKMPEHLNNFKVNEDDYDDLDDDDYYGEGKLLSLINTL